MVCKANLRNIGPTGKLKTDLNQSTVVIKLVGLVCSPDTDRKYTSYIRRSSEIMFGLTPIQVRNFAYVCAWKFNINVPDICKENYFNRYSQTKANEDEKCCSEENKRENRKQKKINASQPRAGRHKRQERKLYKEYSSKKKIRERKLIGRVLNLNTSHLRRQGRHSVWRVPESWYDLN